MIRFSLQNNITEVVEKYDLFPHSCGPSGIAQFRGGLPDLEHTNNMYKANIIH